jgi:hypothetical protein
VTSQKIKSTSCGPVLFIEQKKKRRKLLVGWGLRIFGLTFEPLGYGVCSILNVVPGGLCKPFDGPLHRRLQGDARVTAPEAHKHMVSPYPC